MSEHARYARLSRITQSINSRLNLSKVLQDVVTAISEEIFQCHAVGIFLPDEARSFRGFVGKPGRLNGFAVDELVIDPHKDAFARQIIETKQTVYIPDTSYDPRPDPAIVELFAIKSLMGLPILYENDLYGLVFLFDYGTPMQLASSQIQSIESYVNMAAVAIRNAKLLNHQKTLLHEKQLLLDITKELSLCSSAEEIWSTLFSYVSRMLNNRNIGIHLCNENGEHFRPVKLYAGSDWSEENWQSNHRKLNINFDEDELFQEVVRTKKAIYIPDVTKDARPNHEACRSFGIKGLFLLPLIATGRVLGVVAIPSLGKIREYRKYNRRLVQSIVDVSATALSNVMQMTRLESMIRERTGQLQDKTVKLEKMVSQIRQLSSQNEMILNSAGEGIFGLDPHGYITFCNPSAANILGYERHELTGQYYAEKIYGGAQLNRNLPHQSGQKEGGNRIVEDLFFRKDGSSFPVEYMSNPIIEQGQHKGSVITFKDITVRKQMEEELRATKEQLESFIHYTADGIVLYDVAWHIVRVNSAFENIFGWEAEEIKGQPLLSIPEQHEAELQVIRQKVSAGEPISGYETEMKKKSGEFLPVSVTVSAHRDAEGNIVAYSEIIRDISKHKQAEELLRRSEKLSVVGELAAGIAHEIRNPLTSLKGFVQFLKSNPEQSHQYFDIMLSEINRINLIVSEFIVLAKPQVVQFQTKDFRTILQYVLTLIDTQAIINNVQIHQVVEDSLPLIRCEESQLKQLLINVLKNAIEAMPDGGNVYIYINMKNDEEMLIRIEDEGHGIEASRIPKLGDPFYTTKEKGTGLGLMVCSKILEDHGGRMHIESEVNKGTTVSIVLPVSPKRKDPLAVQPSMLHK